MDVSDGIEGEDFGEVKLTPSRYGNEKNRDRNVVSNVIKSKTE